MFRWFSLAERGRQKRRLELSLAGICELELLKRRHEARVIGALTLHTRAAEPERLARARDSSPQEAMWMKLLQQVGELQVDAGDAADARSGSSEWTEGSCPLSLFDFTRPVRLSERPESVGDVFVGRELISSVPAPVPRSLPVPCAGLEGIGEEPCVWARGREEEDLRQAQRVETYILSLIQRRSPPARPGKPRTSLAPEPRGVARQSSTREPAGAPWADAEQQCSARYPRPVPADSPQHAYQHTHSPSSDELVNARYIPAQPCRAQACRAPKPGRSPERKPRAAARKCRFPEDKIPPKKPGRKACRAQSENNLRGASERKYNTAERSVTPKTRRAAGHRRWRSTLELSQDEAEAEQPIRRSRKPRPHLHPREDPPGESESSLSEAESPASSSLSSDSDESAGLVWPQQLAPPSPPGHSLQPKAFVKIKASHALKKKILRFRSGSLKVMTTV